MRICIGAPYWMAPLQSGKKVSHSNETAIKRIAGNGKVLQVILLLIKRGGEPTAGGQRWEKIGYFFVTWPGGKSVSVPKVCFWMAERKIPWNKHFISSLLDVMCSRRMENCRIIFLYCKCNIANTLQILLLAPWQKGPHFSQEPEKARRASATFFVIHRLWISQRNILCML